MRRPLIPTARSAILKGNRTTKNIEALVRAGPLLGLALLLSIVWVVSFVVFHVAGLLIHILLLLAVIFLVLQLFTGRKS